MGFELVPPLPDTSWVLIPTELRSDAIGVRRFLVNTSLTMLFNLGTKDVIMSQSHVRHTHMRIQSLFMVIFRDEAERVRCGRLGDGVSGRAIVISDREFRNNSKALATSNHQQHGTGNKLSYILFLCLRFTSTKDHPQMRAKPSLLFKTHMTVFSFFKISGSLVLVCVL